MAGFLKAILITMIAVSGLVIFLNLAFFFPWYLTLVEKGFAVSQIVAANNYLPYDDYTDILREIKGLPVFSDREDKIVIEALHDNGTGPAPKDAIERSNAYSMEDYYGEPDSVKPYVQMGNTVKIKLYASYPFRAQIFGGFSTLTDIDVSFSMTTTTTKHYKDLDYEYIFDPYDPGLIADDNFFDWDIIMP